MAVKKIVCLLLVALIIVPLAIVPFNTASARVCDQEFPGSACVWPYSPFYQAHLEPVPAYSVVFVGNWTAADKEAAMAGVNAVGVALTRHSARSPQATFNCVFGETKLYLSGDLGGYYGYAYTHDMAFRPGVVSPRLVVHEIGHLFDDHTLGGTPPPEMLRKVGVYAIDGTKITGTKYTYYYRNQGLRAPDNGYWSDNIRMEWQEHPVSAGAGDNEYEDWGDIWLNWVYGSFVPNKAGWALYAWTDSNMDTWMGRCGW